MILLHKQYAQMTIMRERLNFLKPLASKGDLRAQYFLLQQKQWEQSTKTREQYLNEVIRFAKAHYYQPLMDYIDTILIRPQGSNKHQSKTPEQYDLAVQLLTIASNNNYIPRNKLVGKHF
ncbi:hypothetical protein ACT691_16585 [Vibrio metschnikovii]